MKFGHWFEEQAIICNNKFTESTELPDKDLCPLFELGGDFESDIVVLCSTLIGISNFGYGPIRRYPIFIDGKQVGTSRTLEHHVIFSIISLQQTIEFLLSKMDKGSISNLAFKLLNTDIDDNEKQ
jgi:hypothetical protein